MILCFQETPFWGVSLPWLVQALLSQPSHLLQHTPQPPALTLTLAFENPPDLTLLPISRLQWASNGGHSAFKGHFGHIYRQFGLS